ncbi:phosphoribosylanthranilate isomerase [Paenibacillus eucommiae]|uniref:N-(5'-phosphoribosyl)anthranilate isomerase n=1 Tax=Paenibacillus eucommiae TaxID=1355755 RepID=A0ABS4J4H0_9BACL|nr:phosphoribosylanthranilate isomerase [Paenibacillus eucommiae]MBP1994734.1 phosphoribosylanthranilate isomerase [Paenibacillus eucommiae]
MSMNKPSMIQTPTAKICGIRSKEQLQSIVHLPIAHIGFVFAKSKRQVTPEEAGEMIAYLQELASSGAAVPLTVGVFVNPSEEELERTLRLAPLDAVQLHGQESPAFCSIVKSRFGVQVFKVVPLQKLEASIPSSDAVAWQLDPFRGHIDVLLLDTFDPVYGGGSGKTFAWDCIPVYKEWTLSAGVKLLVAGGLEPGNVAQLLIDYEPDGVDVSSGVETDGVKDLAKIKAFIERVIPYAGT